MSHDMAVAELYWRRFRKHPAGALLLDRTSGSIDVAWSWLREEGMTADTLRRVQREVPWPLFVAWNMEDMARRQHDLVTADPTGHLAASAALHLTWRDTGKRVYRLTPELASGLREARWPATFPAAHLRPPVGAGWLELPLDDQLVHVAWLLDLHTDNMRGGGYELRLLVPSPDPHDIERGLVTALVILDLTAETLDAAVDAAVNRVERNMERENNPTRRPHDAAHVEHMER